MKHPGNFVVVLLSCHFTTVLTVGILIADDDVKAQCRFLHDLDLIFGSPMQGLVGTHFSSEVVSTSPPPCLVVQVFIHSEICSCVQHLLHDSSGHSDGW